MVSTWWLHMLYNQQYIALTACDIEPYYFDVPAVDTYRPKPEVSSTTTLYDIL